MRTNMSVNTQQFISMVEEHTCLWKYADKAFYDKDAKQNAWRTIGSKLFEDWSSWSEEIKVEREKELLKKWRNIRDCYSKDLKARQCPPGKQKRIGSRYLYANMLSFLLQNNTFNDGKRKFWYPSSGGKKHLIGATAKRCLISQDKPVPVSSSNENVITEPNKMHTADIVIQDSSEPQPSSSSLMSSSLSSEETSTISSAKNDQSENEKKWGEEKCFDEDRLFLMSLLPAFKKLDDDRKIDLKVEFLNAVKKIQRSSDESVVSIFASPSSCPELNSHFIKEEHVIPE